MTTIYKITSPSGKKYVGQTRDVIKRKYVYKHNKCVKQKMLYASLLKYGFDNHTFEVLEEVEDHLGDDAEIKWIEAEQSYYLNGGMNLTLGGIRLTHTPEIRQKLSEAILGPKNIRAKKLYQYTLQGEFIKEWECMKCIERELGYFTTWLSEKAKSDGKAYGYLWSYKPLHELSQG